MREILFRGKAANREKGRTYRTKYKNGDWVYGLLTDAENYAGFSEMTNTNGVSRIDVDRNTVGQFTGMIDANGTKIFEGDIVSLEYVTPGRKKVIIKGVVEWEEAAVYVHFCSHGRKTKGLLFGFTSSFHTEDEGIFCKVIGNIHDNPGIVEFLEVTDNA